MDNALNDKLVIDNTADSATLNFNEIGFNASNVNFNGSVYISGDFNVVGKTTQVSIDSEILTIADNMIELNSNLTEDDDPRIVSNIVDGEDTDRNAGIIINRGKAGKLPIIEWVESENTDDDSTLNDAVLKLSIYNKENEQYELHQIVDKYILGKEIEDDSGAMLVGYDGENGINYENNKDADDVDEYSFHIENTNVANAIDEIVDEIDSIKFKSYNGVRIAEIEGGTTFQITHNLGTEYVDVKVQRKMDDGTWMFDVVAIQIIDENTIKIEYSEDVTIRVIISEYKGFVIPSDDIIIS
jgi:hypothetical protein